ncbi:hypothetical protein [Microbacterium sp.]|uniref:hypothetical protein n=1 Tax=Microbacterium sp. TaxID=51671 RepID=UPI0039E4CFF9
MNRHFAAVTIAAVAMFGVTACSGTSGNASDAVSATPTSPTAETSAPATDGDSGDASGEQSVTDACLEIAAPLQEASETMAGLATAATDPQSAVDAWTALVDAFSTVEASATNTEVKAAVSAVLGDITTMRDAISKIYLDGDTSAVTDLTSATTDFQDSYTALTTLCAQ